MMYKTIGLYFSILGMIYSTDHAKATPITVFGLQLSLSENCQLSVIHPDKRINFKPTFNSNGKCRFLTLPNTSFINTVYVNGMYVLFLENHIRSQNGCRSEYTAIGISNSATLYTMDRIESSDRCSNDFEASAFEYFSARLKPYQAQLPAP